MMEFRTFEDVLDFAILQEKAAQQFYAKLSDEVTDPNMRFFYKALVQEEASHEKKLREMKHLAYDLLEPNIEMLRESGYLDAMPISPDITLKEAVRQAIRKEKSAQVLYRTLGQMCESRELAELFDQLAAEEKSHADYFRAKYRDILTEADSTVRD